MVRYSVQLFGLTIFALGLIWFAGNGEAVQSSQQSVSPVYADTVHLEIQRESSVNSPDTSAATKRDTFLRGIKRLQHAAYMIRNNYMEEIDSDKMFKAGIRGMLEDFDRFSVLMEKQSYEALMETTHGKYEGLGMQIDSREEHIIIITPIEGTPAYRMGLHAGDMIMEINGKSTSGMTSTDASKLMRGSAGTSVKLMIKRPGVADVMEFDVMRAVIELKSVNYAGLIPGTDVGYVRLSKFAEESGFELRESISKLVEQNASGVILDLRSNGGGLLDQAKEVSELFLEQGREIVYTRGKEVTSERHLRSDKAPIYGTKPLVVLVNEGTASASEIVAGALQDWDRALIIGNTTYGKGLVQQVFDISNDGSMAVKLTTAKYYVPSGRCIQKPEVQGKDHPDTEVDVAGAKKGEDTMAVAEKPIFYTNAGRIVYGGGGIVPDIELEHEPWKPIEINLERKSMFFDFAVKYVADHPGIDPNTFQVTDEIVKDFQATLKEKKFDYKTSTQVALEKLDEIVKDDSGEEKLFKAPLDSLRKLVEVEKANDFDESLDYIKRGIETEIISSVAGERGVYEQIVLRQDKAVLKALEVLGKKGEYTTLMTKGVKRTSVN
jgi:carboxyl-terminal processing protease